MILEIGFVTIVALTIGLVEAIKRSFTALPSNYMPMIAIVIGICLSICAKGAGLPEFIDMNAWYLVLLGIAIGLSSVGLFSGVKNTIQ
ncbi:MAG: hypothetical protein MNSN_08130 [Minisyncoccus archaeiphilus]|uniref:hypothetical protein n=1 Tax=Minisyncoccus archaeiphilus TaxID=3238481 RepID=UPI002B162DA4|nr:MAG: hypothetical protein MNSN_08130 [Candidatus Parcubacteria bacterium]